MGKSLGVRLFETGMVCRECGGPVYFETETFEEKFGHSYEYRYYPRICPKCFYHNFVDRGKANKAKALKMGVCNVS